MKKTLLVLAAAVALVFGLASCNTPSNTDSTGGAGASDTVYTLTTPGNYSGPEFSVAADAKEVIVEFAEAPTGYQMVVKSDAVEKVESWGNAYYCTYPQITSTKVVVDLAKELAALKEASSNVTKVVSVTIQNNKGDSNSCKIKSVSVKNADDTVTALTFPTPAGWETWTITK